MLLVMGMGKPFTNSWAKSSVHEITACSYIINELII